MNEIKEVPPVVHRRPKVWEAIQIIFGMFSRNKVTAIDLEMAVNILIDVIVEEVKKETT